jgi:hypothetical protein
MGDLTSKRWIVAKGVMFICLAMVVAGLLVLERPSLRTLALLVVLVWSSCRFYYFAFYVLEKYVDPRLRYAGLIALVGATWRKRGRAAHE